MVERIAVIPARGGSKRLPKKNIMPFCGKPMIAWTIEAAIASQMFSRVLVSTDSDEIAAIAKSHRAEVPFLREAYSDDHTPVRKTTTASVRQAEEYWDMEFDQVVQLMANCPLRRAEHIQKAIVNFESIGGDFQISCFRFGWMNPWWATRLGQNGEPTPVFETALQSRSQDLDALYCPTGAIWIASRDGLLREETFYGVGYRFYPLDWRAAVDIDVQDDVDMAEAIAIMQSRRGLFA